MKEGQVPFDRLIDVAKAHDIRTLRICTHCSEMGNSPAMIEHGASWYHGRCFAAACGEKALLALPKDKTRSLKLGDLGVDLMKSLIGRRK